MALFTNGSADADTTNNPLPPFAHVMRGKAANAYEALASSDSYRRVAGRLKLIDLCAATLAAISTAYVNGFSHTARIGIVGAVVLAVLTFAIVEFSTFTLEDGLRETFKGGTQRLLANLIYWAIRATMIATGVSNLVGRMKRRPGSIPWTIHSQKTGAGKDQRARATLRQSG